MARLSLLAYVLNFTFRIGYAKGLASGGLDKFYFVATVPSKKKFGYSAFASALAAGAFFAFLAGAEVASPPPEAPPEAPAAPPAVAVDFA